VHTDATVTLRPVDGVPTITKIALVTVGKVPGLDEASFVEHANAAEVLFADGDRSYDMIVVLEGTVEIVEHHGHPDERVIITYGPREFLGEMGLLTGQSVYLSALATSDGRVLRVPPDRSRSSCPKSPT
jgi:CRP-like cAMP-binding protein